MCRFIPSAIFDQYAPTREEQLGPVLLHDVSEETGGQLFA